MRAAERFDLSIRRSDPAAGTAAVLHVRLGAGMVPSLMCFLVVILEFDIVSIALWVMPNCPSGPRSPSGPSLPTVLWVNHGLGAGGVVVPFGVVAFGVVGADFAG